MMHNTRRAPRTEAAGVDTATYRADPDRDGTVFVRDLTRPFPMGGAPDVGDAQRTPGAARAATPDGTVVRVATSDDAPALRAAMDASGFYPRNVVETRRREGRLPYILIVDGLVACYGWVALTPQPIGDLGISFLLADGDAYIYDCATRPAYRRRGLYPELLRFIAVDLRNRGLRRAWIATAPGNAPSWKGIARAGYEKVADCRMTRESNGRLHVTVMGVPGVPEGLLRLAAWSFHGTAVAGAGIPL